MPNMMYGQNYNMMNQLLRQKDSIDNLIQQYSQPQAPVQNIINTGANLEFEARILQDNEEAENILVNRRTMFLDKKNKKLLIKELDGKISEEYEIIVPLDEKDKRILDLENKLKEMEGKINEYSKFIKSNDEFKQPVANCNELIKSSTETISEPVSKSTK